MNRHEETYAPSYRATWRDRLPGPLAQLAGFRWWTLAVAMVVALLLAQQFATPNSRIIKAVAGLILFGVSLRLQPFHALCFITLFFPFPFSIFVGSSTMIFVVLTAIITLARITMKQVEPLRRTPVDYGLLVLMGCYIISFYNVTNPVALRGGIINMIAIVSAVILFYLTANYVRTEAQLRTYVKIMVITLAACMFVGLYELFLPGKVLVPHWILNARPRFAGTEGYRVAGPYYDFELYGELMALGFFLCIFYMRRANNPNTRFFAMGLAIVSVFCLLATVTRGATLAFAGGVVYIVFLIRRRLKFRDLISGAMALIALTFGLEFVVTNFTRSGSVMDRMLGTEFVGFIPETRGAWPMIFEHVLEHPFIGHGPYYDLGKSETLTGQGLYSTVWPHNLYLFLAHTVGFIGMFAFIFVAGRLLYLSFKTKAISLQEDSYPKSLMVVLHVMLLVFLVDQTKIEYLRNTTYLFFPWMLMGLIAANLRIIREQDAGLQPRIKDP